ncbi:MAG: hypothetical protein BRD30_12295 [Bacteroidetes bacterium QH_2_63_10]|nr:MAG: hypothetical protein BRD30_12295 [Bacteroidetes bacterium QH_2_63_10]
MLPQGARPVVCLPRVRLPRTCCTTSNIEQRAGPVPGGPPVSAEGGRADRPPAPRVPLARQRPRAQKRRRTGRHSLTGPRIAPSHLPVTAPDAEEAADSDAAVGRRVSLETLEKEHIRRVVATTETLEDAAETLDIDPATLYRKRQKYDLG